MSEPKFTPGPWKHSSDEGDYFTVTARATEIVSGCGCCGSPWVNSEADAHLIAAAPDLYKALAHLEPYLDAIVCYASTIEEHPPNGFILETKAALAKARGEG